MDWIIWIIVLLVIVGVVAGIVTVVMKASAKATKADHAVLAAGAYGTDVYGGTAAVQLQLYAQGMRHRSAATTFGVLGLFILGIVFGPLALVQANKAEAFGVKATAGKILGWISLAFAVLWLTMMFGHIPFALLVIDLKLVAA